MSRKGTPIIQQGQEHRKNFVNLFNSFSGKYAKWQIWQDFIYCSATALSQPIDFRQEREDEYLRIIQKYDKREQDLFAQMLGEIILALEEEGFSDVLGELYMQLEMHNKWHGQFFTPMCIADFMGAIVNTDIVGLVEKKGYISVNEPSCGSGVMLISFCKNATEQGINYQQQIMFVAQDIDPVVAQMCYIQMSLQGMAGYVIVGNSLLNNYKQSDYWYTPMYFSEIWHYRRKFQRLMAIMSAEKTSAKPTAKEYDIVLNEDEYGQLSFAV